ncbi:MAG: type II toxin-antitoxin system VapC family toxin [Candidatus Acidiferrum sp.]
MNFLLDANVVSEWVKPRPDPGVVEWLANADEDRLFLSVATLAELRYGIERMPTGRKSTRLREWLEMELTGRFEDRVVAIDETVAATWGILLAKADAAGRPMGSMDGFLAATAVVHQMMLVTRNEMDFSAAGINTINPWSE